METKEDVYFKIKNAMNLTDNIFDECDSIFKRKGLDYDVYDRVFFSMFRKLIVRWKGVGILLKNDQAENADVFMRTIVELEGCLEFILLENNIELISKKVISYEYNSLLEQIKVLSVSNKEAATEAKKKLHSESVFEQVKAEIDKKKSLGKYKYYWANVYLDKNIGNFIELMEYIDQFYNLNVIDGYSQFWKQRYKNLSTEIHSNILKIRHFDFDYYRSSYTKEELFSVMDLLIMFDTVLSDFISYLKTKYNVDSESEKNIDILKTKLVNIILQDKSKILD
ncbi:DUF5677 domain-containing protein [Enterococcus hirae]|uniref:DUF5677 domain-containing protein n=1 Tax=Enterococcus faecium TaxID=1352 RepID=UPI000DEAE5C1|nr:DUF5677 domain-containing protein [Enterococcus faecium]RBT20042.1 hypothetical protein EB00_02689 [Enterococcus faecium]